MNKLVNRRIAFSVLIGLVITTVSGLSYNYNIFGEFPDVRFTTDPVLGVGYWGYILPWLKQVVYPGAAKSVIWSNFIIDVLIWSIVAYIILAAFKLPAVKTKPRPSRKRKR